jgi:microcystin-dependent protein
MADLFLGNIILVGFNFAPRGTLPCDGRLLAIQQNAALFSLLGTQYGGNGTTNFALPDLRGRVPVGQGTGPGLTSIQIGQASGVTSTTLTPADLPSHTHALNAQSGAGTASLPGTGTVLALSVVDDGTPVRSYSTATSNTALSDASLARTLGDGPIEIRNPYVGLMYVIATQGIFPSRN